MITVCDNRRHLVCLPYSIENLHAAARAIGIKRCWFHKNHYDIPLYLMPAIGTMVDKVVDTRTIVNIIKGKVTEL